MSIIDLMLRGKEAELLFDFLAHQQTTGFWNKNELIKRTQDYWPWGETVEYFTLSHSLVVRERKNNQPGLRFEVVGDEALGVGANGVVYPILQTIKLEGTEIVGADKGRAVKVQEKKWNQGTHLTVNQNKKIQHDFERRQEEAEHEQSISAEASQINAKPLVTEIRQRELLINGETRLVPPSITNAMVMKNLPGVRLTDLLKTRLTDLDRAEIMAAVLLAYKNQVLAPGLIHGDIKPDNIIIDKTKNPIEVNFCDYGFARFIEGGHPLTGGTPNYIAPEVFTTGTSIASDLYSLGMVLSRILGVKEQFKFREEVDVFYHDETAEIFPQLKPQLFANINFAEINRPPIENTLSALCSRDPTKRKDIDLAIIEIEKTTYFAGKDKYDPQSKKEQLIRSVHQKLNQLERRACFFKEQGLADIAVDLRKTKQDIRKLTQSYSKAEDSPNNMTLYAKSCHQQVMNLQKNIDAKTTKFERSIGIYLANFITLLATFFVPYMIAATVKYNKTGNYLFFSNPLVNKKQKEVDDLKEDITQLQTLIPKR